MDYSLEFATTTSARATGLRLNQILDADSAARRYYLQYIAVHSALTTAAGCSAVDAHMAVERMTLERFAACTTLTPVCELETSRFTGGRRWQSLIRWTVSLSAALLLAMSALWWAQRDSRSEVKSGSVADVRPENVSDGSADPGRLVAEVTYVSNSAIWQNPNGSYAIASHVRSGQTLTLERGQIELTYLSGTKLLLTGPTEFLVQPAGGKLRRGELVARVPEAGHGFTIETPHGKVVDLGTEFGVVVDDFGVSQVSVFEGKVETFPTGTVRNSRDKIELTSGRGDPMDGQVSHSNQLAGTPLSSS